MQANGRRGILGVLRVWRLANGRLDAYKKPLLRPGGCLEPLLWPCGGFCLRACPRHGRPNDRALCRQTAGEAFLGVLRVWRAGKTAALNAYKKPLLRPGGCLEPLLWPCGGFCLRAWRLLGLLGVPFACEVGRCACGSGACWALC